MAEMDTDINKWNHKYSMYLDKKKYVINILRLTLKLIKYLHSVGTFMPTECFTVQDLKIES